MPLEDQIKELQFKVDLISIYKIISNFKQLPFKKEYNIKKGVSDEILSEMVKWANEKINNIENGLSAEVVKANEENNAFSEDEVKILKQLASRFIKSDILAPLVEVAPEEAKPLTYTDLIKVNDKGKVLCVSNIEPPLAIEKVSPYDCVRVTGFDKRGNKYRVVNDETGVFFTIPVEDIEAI